ncbi:MAG: hypothetical protein O7G86_07500 [Gammaproteobacteria bacterium]|nr:hypothetical protein [Gammaproteobacteria bacterium]MCZ6853749.1 hypothetical protein [Gammaproteobacteria bacterium]
MTITVLWVIGLSSTGLANAEGEFPRAYNGHPDLSGIWQAIGTAHWNIQDHPASAGPPELGAIGATPPGRGVVEDDEIPYQPWALDQKRKNFENRLTEDPETKCYLPGVPRATYLPYPFQILQGTNKIMIVYGVAEANRTIHMDKKSPEPAPIDSWMGRSHGHWEGDTLVVDVAGFNGQAWFDRAGNFASDTLRVIERYTPIGSNALNYEATIEDPNVFTGTWKMTMPLYRRLEENAQVLEFKCVEFSEELLYGHLRKSPTP